MNQSDPRTNEPSAKAAGGAGKSNAEEKRVRAILDALVATRPDLNEETKDSLVELDPKSDVAKKIAGLDNPNNRQLTTIINYHKGVTKLAVTREVKAKKHTDAFGRVFSCIKAGQLFHLNGRLLRTTEKEYETFLSIRNEADKTHHTIRTHNQQMLKAGFERVYRDDDGNVFDKGVYAWTHKDESLDISISSHAAKLSVNHYYGILGKGKGRKSQYAKEEHHNMAMYLQANPNKKMKHLTDDEAEAIATGRSASAVLMEMSNAFGSTLLSRASNHPNFALALLGKELDKKKPKANSLSRYSDDKVVEIVKLVANLKRKPTDDEVRGILDKTSEGVLSKLASVFGTKDVKSLLRMTSFQEVVKNGVSSLPSFKLKKATSASAEEMGASKEPAIEDIALGKENNPNMGSELPEDEEFDTKLPAKRKGKVKADSNRSANKGKSSSATKSTSNSKLPVNAGKHKPSTVTRRIPNSKLPAERQGKAASNGNAKKRTKIAAESVAPTKKRRSSGQDDVRCMEMKEAEDEKEDYEPSDYESNDDDYNNDAALDAIRID